MKRKKWSELEELTLLCKYSDLLSSGTLSKLKTREKKFRPVADHVNSVHHLQDPLAFPFKWSWRDVSIKVQNMRHQYLGVKQKIKISDDEFNWKDGENHWENFLKYKEVFGDVELEIKSKRANDSCSSDFFKDCGDFGFGIDSEDDEEDGDGEGDNNGCEEEGEFEGEKGNGETCCSRKGKVKKGCSKKLGLLSAQVVDLRDTVMRREEKRREREFSREKSMLESEERMKEFEVRRETRRSQREERLENWEMELEDREFMLSRRAFERQRKVERELEEERKRRRRMEEKREEEEMEWRERMVAMQIEHEKAMMQMHADACQNQMQILGLMARFICQYFGASDGLGGGLGGLPPQVLQNLQDPGGLSDNGKPDTNSPSEFM